MLCIPFGALVMSNVYDFNRQFIERHDKKITQWLLDGGMPKNVMDMITNSVIDMRRLVGHPEPQVGMFASFQFRRCVTEDTDVWEVGMHDIFPIQFIYNDPFSSEGIEHLYHSNDHDFVFGTYSNTDATQVIVALVKEFHRKKKLLEDDQVSPLLYFLNAGIARSFELIKPNLVMGGFSAKAQAFLLHMQSETESIQWSLHYDPFLSIPLNPAEPKKKPDEG
jgi:hypothetical protein